MTSPPPPRADHPREGIDRPRCRAGLGECTFASFFHHQRCPMAPAPTARGVCRHCGNEWRPGWERCRRCGATLRNRITAPVDANEATDVSGLELDRRRRSSPKEAITARVARVEASESPTRELSTEPAPSRDPATLVSLTQVLTGALGLLLLAQLLFPAALPSLTGLTLRAIRGGAAAGLWWFLAAVPWILAAGVLGMALAASRAVTAASRMPAPALAAVLAVVPGVLLRGWPALHEHLVSAIVRRGGRKPGALLTGWS